MDDRREREAVQHAVDTTLSGLQGNPWRVQRVLAAAQAKGEKRTMKKRFSVALVVMLALMLTSVTALAVGLGHYFAGFKALEDQYGDFDEWPTAAQVELVQVMLDSGVLSAESAPGWSELSGTDKEAAAQAALDSYFGEMIFIDTYNVMERILGSFEDWTDEQRAMYTDLLVQYGEQRDDEPYYMAPSGSDLTREQAVQRAKEHLVKAHAIDAAHLDTLPVSAYFSATSYNDEGLPADEPYWSVYIGEGEDWQMVTMTRTGELLSLHKLGEE